ncbi:hypothetical protein [Aquimarina sp. Aq78]|uniref:GntT/GntP/DsdX family permease n=1 Tax=Aquimarina sp. Aq78 TaxID=1191889 RepID=UPI000D104EC1|nr:hypothetical protein [Aquimarina sp. Aq78]
MPLVIIVLGILLLFISFIIVCIFVGVLQNMELQNVIQSIQTGIGNTLGFLVMILGLGTMLSKLFADSGVAQRITLKLVSSFGVKYIQSEK